MIINMRTAALAAAILVTASIASAQEDPAATIAAKLPGVDPEKITETPLDGIYEIGLGPNIAYVSGDARYLLRGDLIDLDSDVNLTEQRRDTSGNCKIDLWDFVQSGRIVRRAQATGGGGRAYVLTHFDAEGRPTIQEVAENGAKRPNKRLFLGESDFMTLSNVRKQEVPAPSSINPDVPPEIDAILLKCLAKDRDERHADVEQFNRELTRWFYASVDDLDAVALRPFMQNLGCGGGPSTTVPSACITRWFSNF